MSEPTLAEVDASPFLFLVELSEPRETALRVVVAGGSLGIVEQREIVEGLVLPTQAMDAAPPLFSLTWPSYIAYGLRNESYASGEAPHTGRLVRVYASSNYLDYVKADTIASSDHPGPFRHWEICCLNHVIDIVSTDDPHIAVLPTDDRIAAASHAWFDVIGETRSATRNFQRA